MPKFRKKPVVIEAVQFVWDDQPVAGRMFMHWPIQRDARGAHVVIPTLEGDHRADPGDWIIKGVKGEFYPCKPDIFAATYEPVEEPTQEDEPTDPSVIPGHHVDGFWITPKSSCCAVNVVYFDPDVGRYVHWNGIRETDRELFCGACNILLAAAPPQDTEPSFMDGPGECRRCHMPIPRPGYSVPLAAANSFCCCENPQPPQDTEEPATEDTDDANLRAYERARRTNEELKREVDDTLRSIETGDQPATEDTERCVWAPPEVDGGMWEAGCGWTTFHSPDDVRELHGGKCACGKPISVEDTQKEEESDDE